MWTPREDQEMINESRGGYMSYSTLSYCLYTRFRWRECHSRDTAGIYSLLARRTKRDLSERDIASTSFGFSIMSIVLSHHLF